MTNSLSSSLWGSWFLLSVLYSPNVWCRLKTFFLPVLGSGGGRRDGPPGLSLEGLLQPHPEHGECG